MVIKDVAGKVLWLLLGVSLGATAGMFWYSHQLRLAQVSAEIQLGELNKALLCEHVVSPVTGNPAIMCATGIAQVTRQPNGIIR